MDLQALAGEFGVPVVQLDELAAAARDYGQPIPANLRPEPYRGLEGEITLSFSQAARMLGQVGRGGVVPTPRRRPGTYIVTTANP